MISNVYRAVVIAAAATTANAADSSPLPGVHKIIIKIKIPQRDTGDTALVPARLRARRFISPRRVCVCVFRLPVQ